MSENTTQQFMPPNMEAMMKQFQKELENKSIKKNESEELETAASINFLEEINRLKSEKSNNASEPDELQIRSDSYTDFICIRPRFFEKWGIAIIALIIALGLLACCFIKYPEIVKGNIKVQSENAPKALLPNISGKITTILRKNNDILMKGDNIIYLESTANHNEVLSAYKEIERFTLNIDKIAELDFSIFDNHIFQYGELQSQIQNFKQNYLNYKDNLNSGIFEKKRSIIQNDIRILGQQIDNINSQKKGAEEELKFYEEKSKTNEILYKSGVIARDDYNTVQANFVAKKNTLMQFTSTKLSYEAQTNQKKRELIELEQQAKNQQSLFIESLNTLKSQFDEWINKYIIKAPINGILVYTSFIQENQLLQAGKSFGMISPDNNENYVEMYISQQIFPKVKLNQDVVLKFPAYPIQDYGYIKGKINYISPQLNDSCFLVKVNCNKEFITSNKLKVNMKHGMTGIGEIIVKDKTIMGRMVSKMTEKLRVYP